MFNAPFRQQESLKSEPSQPPAATTLDMNSQINAGLGIGGSNNASDQSTQYYNSQQQTPFYNTGMYISDFVGMPNMDFLNAVPADDLNADMTGIDLSFAMGTDFQHDWNDGTQFDLFDGFFFGNGNGGG
jgi:hypothetical protein